VLAAELGTASETLSRTLAKFRADQLIKVSGRSITIPNPEALDRLLRQNLGEITAFGGTSNPEPSDASCGDGCVSRPSGRGTRSLNSNAKRSKGERQAADTAASTP